MRYFIYILFFLLCTYHHASLAQSIQEQTDWASDIDFLGKELPEKHINLFSIKSRDYFAGTLSALKAQASQLSDQEISFKLQQIIASMGDSHTGLNFFESLNRQEALPLNAYWYEDGIYVLGTTEIHEHILGLKLVSLNGHSIGVIADSLASLISRENEAIFRKQVPELLKFKELLYYFGFAKKGEAIILDLTDKNGKNVTETFENNNADIHRVKRITLEKYPLRFKRQKDPFWMEYVEQDSILYIQYNKCISKEVKEKYKLKSLPEGLPSFKQFEREVLNVLREEPIKKVIIDLRNNTGGSSPQGTEFAKKLKKIPGMAQKGKVFVLIGRATFSSAILNAMDFKTEVNATFVGEETGGSPNHFGEVRYMQLPSSHLKVAYSTKHFKRVSGDIHTLRPDIEVKESFADTKAGIDACYEIVRQLQPVLFRP